MADNKIEEKAESKSEDKDSEGILSSIISIKSEPSIGDWPMLKVVVERFYRALVVNSVEVLSSNISISQKEHRLTSFAEYNKDVNAESSVLCICKCDKLDSNGIIVFDKRIFSYVLNSLMGGNRDILPEQKKKEGEEVLEYTDIERSIALHFSDFILNNLSDAFKIIESVDMKSLNLSEDLERSGVLKNDDSVVAISFGLKFNEEELGGIDVVLPHSSLMIIDDSLSNVTSIDQVNSVQRWKEDFASQVDAAEVPVEAVLCNLEFSMSELMEISVGQTIMTDKSEGSEVEIYVNGSKFFMGRTGKADKNIAVQVTEVIKETK